MIGQYIHNAISEGVGKIGVIVALESTGDKDQLAELGRKIAMHVAAASPLALDAAAIDPAVLEREKNVLRDKNAGKPAHVLEKIVESGLKTYFKEVTLLEQPFIHDNAKTVSQAVAEAAKTVGAPVALKGFVRYALGEGIEKQEIRFRGGSRGGGVRRSLISPTFIAKGGPRGRLFSFAEFEGQGVLADMDDRVIVLVEPDPTRPRVKRPRDGVVGREQRPGDVAFFTSASSRALGSAAAMRSKLSRKSSPNSRCGRRRRA